MEICCLQVSVQHHVFHEGNRSMLMSALSCDHHMPDNWQYLLRIVIYPLTNLPIFQSHATPAGDGCRHCFSRVNCRCLRSMSRWECWFVKMNVCPTGQGMIQRWRKCLGGDVSECTLTTYTESVRCWRCFQLGDQGWQREKSSKDVFIGAAVEEEV